MTSLSYKIDTVAKQRLAQPAEVTKKIAAARQSLKTALFQYKNKGSVVVPEHGLITDPKILAVVLSQICAIHNLYLRTSQRDDELRLGFLIAEFSGLTFKINGLPVHVFINSGSYDLDEEGVVCEFLRSKEEGLLTPKRMLLFPEEVDTSSHFPPANEELRDNISRFPTETRKNLAIFHVLLKHLFSANFFSGRTQISDITEIASIVPAAFSPYPQIVLDEVFSSLPKNVRSRITILTRGKSGVEAAEPLRVFSRQHCDTLLHLSSRPHLSEILPGRVVHKLKQHVFGEHL